MQIQTIGKSDGSYTTIPRIVGEDIICLRAEIHDREQLIDGKVFVLSSRHTNDRMMFYRVEKVGINVTAATGIVPGDYIYVDMLARFADTFPISFINYRSVLFKTDSEGKEVHALSGRIIVDVIEPTEKVNEFGFIQLTDIDPYGVVVSIGSDCEDRGFSVGDRVSLHKSEDSQTYMLGSHKYFDYDYRTPAVKFLERHHAD